VPWAGLIGAYLQIYPRFDFQHFLFGFPLAALALAWSAERVGVKWMKHLAVVVFVGVIISGFSVVGRQYLTVLKPENNLAGIRSRGKDALYNQEITEVQQFLLSQGWKEGEPLLILPHEETLYYLLRAKNSTPHNQFLPAYVESFGESQETVFTNYLNRGGKWAVLGYLPVLEKAAPFLAEEFPAKFSLEKKFPNYFSIWRAKN
jgi:hypothetical protein